MANIRELNQRSPEAFWEWISQMNQNLPHRPADDNNAAAGNGEGSSRQPPAPQNEKSPATEKGDVDPPTPPEEIMSDDDFDFEKHADTVPPAYGGAEQQQEQQQQDEQTPAGEGSGRPHGRRRRGGPHGGPHHFGRGRGGPWAGRGGWAAGRGGFGGPGGPGGPFRAFAHCGYNNPAAWRGAGRQPWAWYPKMFMEHMRNCGPDGCKHRGGNSDEDGVDFEPSVDVFETPATYVVHVSLPGAKKDDVAVTWDEGRSSLTIGGVITRDVDEKMAESLALSERDIGVFRRVVRLGDMDHPAAVNGDGIAAKMEDGILKLTVPKVEGFVEVKKVQIQ